MRRPVLALIFLLSACVADEPRCDPLVRPPIPAPAKPQPQPVKVPTKSAVPVHQAPAPVTEISEAPVSRDGVASLPVLSADLASTIERAAPIVAAPGADPDTIREIRRRAAAVRDDLDAIRLKDGDVAGHIEHAQATLADLNAYLDTIGPAL